MVIIFTFSFLFWRRVRLEWPLIRRARHLRLGLWFFFALLPPFFFVFCLESAGKEFSEFIFLPTFRGGFLNIFRGLIGTAF